MQNHLMINGMGFVLPSRQKQNVGHFRVWTNIASLKVLSSCHYWEMVELLRTGTKWGL